MGHQNLPLARKEASARSHYTPREARPPRQVEQSSSNRPRFRPGLAAVLDRRSGVHQSDVWWNAGRLSRRLLDVWQSGQVSSASNSCYRREMQFSALIDPTSTQRCDLMHNRAPSRSRPRDRRTSVGRDCACARTPSNRCSASMDSSARRVEPNATRSCCSKIR
jgi:hypothetical protein